MLHRITSRWVLGIGLGLAVAACNSGGGDNRTSGETASGGTADAGGGSTDAPTMSTEMTGTNTGTDAGAGNPTDAGTTSSSGGMLAGAQCSNAITLTAGMTLAGQDTSRGGAPSTLCRPSDAPQRFYTFQLPAHMRATVTVTPTTMFTPVARVMVSCTATECLTDAEADGPGRPVSVVVDSPGDETVTKIVTVSGQNDKDRGSFSIALSLNAMDDGSDGTTDGGTDGGGTMISHALAPRAIAPLSTSTVTSRRPTFHWTLAAGTTGAQVELCADHACTMSEGTFNAVGSSAAPSFDLSPGVHFWRLRGVDAMGAASTTSATWEFIVGARSAAVDTSWGTTPDFNGDGTPDLVTGAEQRDATGNSNGYVFVYSNTGNGLPTTPTYQLSYPGRGLMTVSSLGDVNGDGYGDLSVSYPNGINSGHNADIYYGGPGQLSSASMTTLTTADGLTLNYGLFPAGDVNGDGYADVMVAHSFDIVVLYGGAMGLDATRRLELPRLHNSISWDVPRFAPAGDVNGDGFADVIVWYHNQDGGASDVVVLDGSPAGLSPVVTRIGGFEYYPGVGASDVNGDGYADVGVSAQGLGTFSVYLGGASGVSTTPASTFTYDGILPDRGIALGGDFDGDGYGDFVTMHNVRNNGTHDLHFEVLHGGAGGLTTLEDLAFPYVRENFNPIRGESVGDVNHDGIAELILQGTANDVSEIEVLPGTTSGPNMTSGETLTWPGNASSPSPTNVISLTGAR